MQNTKVKLLGGRNMNEFLNNLNGILWGTPTMVLLFTAGLLFSVKTKFFQIRKLGYILKNTLGKVFKKEENTNEGVMTPFQAVSTALAGTVGTANMAGVAAAIVIGGPGAVFWMWVIAGFGMMTKMVEVTLAVHYRNKSEDGSFFGGPMYYIEKGLGQKWKPMAMFFSFMMMLGSMGTAVFVQPHTMSTTMNSIFNIPPVVTVVTVVAICAVVIIGGFKSIGKFCEKITPTMCIIYIIAALGILVVNAARIPEAFGMIFKYAFMPMPAVGGFAGSTLAIALRRGVARGTFSNEAGMGSAPMVHATAKTDHPISQGLYGAFEVFVDTILVCTATALVILTSGTELWTSGLDGIDLTMAAFSNIYGGFGKAIVGIGVLLFALSTMIGFYVEFETSAAYIFGTKYIKYFKILYLIPPFLTLGKTTQMIWTIVDISVAIVVIPNVIALIMLSKVFLDLYKDYDKKFMQSSVDTNQSAVSSKH